MATKEQLDSFHSFASRHLDTGHNDLSMDELYDLWCCEDLPPEELAESVAAVRAALADMEAGDIGVPVEEHLAQLRTKYQIPDRA